MGTGLHNGTNPEDQGTKRAWLFSFFVSLTQTPPIKGIVPRCIVELFSTMEQHAKDDPDFKYDIYVSFLELYNEELVDLLNPQTIQRRKGTSTSPTTEVTIREDVAGNIYWSGVREERCSCPDELLG